jgi:hypothetical protein
VIAHRRRALIGASSSGAAVVSAVIPCSLRGSR